MTSVDDAGAENAPASSCVVRPLVTLTRRSDFLRAAKARRAAMPGFVLQARDRRDETAGARIGFTASKKVGNAVARNRAKRRLRVLARLSLAPLAHPGWDYVLIARAGSTSQRPFADLQSDLARAMQRVHG